MIKKTAKRAASSPARKAAKKVSKKKAKKPSSRREVYPAARLTAENLGLHTSVTAGNIIPPRRDYSDTDNLQRLYDIGCALQYWAVRFNERNVAALAASCVDSASIYRLLDCVKSQIAGYAPEVNVPTAGGPAVSGAVSNLDAAVFMAMQLPHYVDENFHIRWAPAGPDADDPIDMDWVPPETTPVKSVRGIFKGPVQQAVSLDTWWADFLPAVQRAAQLAAAAVRTLNDHIDSDGKGGFSHDRVEAWIESLSPSSPNRRTHEEFMWVLATLSEIAGRSDAGQWCDWVQWTQHLQTIYGKWCDTCFGPAVTGKPSHAERGKRKSKKDCLRRLVATASQYGTLLQGTAVLPKVTAAIHILDELGRRLEKRVRTLHPAAVQPDACEVRRLVHVWDTKIVTEGDLEYWIRSLGPKAGAVGRICEIIGGYESPQEGPWEPKEHSTRLRSAGVLMTKKPKEEFTNEEFTDIRIRMQAAGIAVQAPWRFITGKVSEPETKSGVAYKWLLNPLAQILAPHSR